jgi:thiol:disulfide interchange protein DsbD
MIPITAGILQAQGSSSLLMNFLLSASYTTGIATTFAILGLLAAFAGQAMGSLMTNPLFIFPLVALLIYLALSMIGLYDMYIPKFFQPRDHKVTGGSFVSAFVFGMVSGIVASPCLSPGLLCLLCIVTTIGSKLLGFIMLFVFGIGLGIPLLIIGTFSGSLNLLPRAGMWMVEIKKLFGYVMLAMCLYFISYIVNTSVMLSIITLFCLTIGIIFLTYSRSAHSKTWRMVYNILGIALIAGSVVSAFKTYQSYNGTSKASAHQWHTDYQAAKEEALKQNKKLFVDVGAPFCSICKAIDATLFSDAIVIATLEDRMVPVKIDGSDTRNNDIMKRYKIFGFPTILCVDPATETVIKKWGAELYGTKTEAFLQEIGLIE